jgi:hypothetical protein
MMKVPLLVLLALAAAGAFVVGGAVTHFGKPYVSEKSESEFGRSESGRMIKAHVQVTIKRCEWPAFWQACRTYVAEVNGLYIADSTSRSVTGVLRLTETVSIAIDGRQEAILTCNSFSVSGLPDVQSCKTFTGEQVDNMLAPMRHDFNTRELLGPELRRLQQQQEEQLRNDAPVTLGRSFTKEPREGLFDSHFDDHRQHHRSAFRLLEQELPDLVA